MISTHSEMFSSFLHNEAILYFHCGKIFALTDYRYLAKLEFVCDTNSGDFKIIKNITN